MGEAPSRASTALKVSSREEPHGDPVRRPQEGGTLSPLSPPSPAFQAVSPSREPRSALPVRNLAAPNGTRTGFSGTTHSLGRKGARPPGGCCESVRPPASGGCGTLPWASAPPRLGRPHARPESAPRALAGSLVAARGLSVPRCSAHSAEGCAEEAPPGSRLRHGRAPLSAPQHLCQGPIALATPKRRPRCGRQARGCVGKGTGRAASPAAGAPHPGSPAASLGRRARGQGRSCRPPRGLPDRPGRNSTAAVSAGIAAPTAFRSLQLARKRGRGGDYEAGGRAQGGSGGPRLDGGGSLGPKPCELCLAGTRLLWRKPRAREEPPHGTVRPGVLGGQAASRGPGSPTLLCLPPPPRRRGRASAQRPRRDVRAHALAQIRRSSLLLGPFPRKSGAVGLSPGERARGRDWAPRSQGAREGGGRSPGGAPGPAAPWASSWTASTATWTRT